MGWIKKILLSQKSYNQDKSLKHEQLSLGKEAPPLSKDLKENQSNIEKAFENAKDFQIENIHVGNKEGMICYLNSMTDTSLLAEKIMVPLSNSSQQDRSITNLEEFESYRKEFFSGVGYRFHDKLHGLIDDVLAGYAGVIVDGQPKGLSLHVGNIEYRPIEEPSTQTVIRGPKEGFTESMDTNISLIRRRIQNTSLKFESMTVGKDTRTSVTIAYIDGVMNEGILEEVKERIKKIRTHAIFDSGNVEEYISDKTMTVFPLIYNTERPDSAAANLLEGKAVIIVNGSPFVLIAPTVFSDFFEATEDYYQSFFMGSFIRLIRYASFLIALTLPSLYVALTAFHHALIPTDLLFSLQAQREGVPFPAVIELLIMEVTFEILREAGIRMPRAIGQTISIVGALVIGQAAVEAGLVSNALVIVIALTALATFVSPIASFTAAARLLRFIFIFMAALFGLYGILLCLFFMVAHLVSLRSFGVPYLAPIAPFIAEDQEDVFLRFPSFSNKRRPHYLKTESPLKNPGSESPTPPPSKKGSGS
ncbi:spore germination protein [Halobacillus trueperi]|uniref:Spore germination protein n=1 Tax=Halobacillus trueperi TaxID=156205 RepID=A0A3E0J3R6_9BACI|nr:spore germination protein [Halobacillus trueperi]REJ07562.1 spore germination protein [Halobacillus trueperi]